MQDTALYVLEPPQALESTTFHPFYQLRSSIRWETSEAGKCVVGFFLFDRGPRSGNVSLLFAGPAGNTVYRAGMPRTKSLRDGFRLFNANGIETDVFLFNRIHNKNVASARVYKAVRGNGGLLFKPQYDLRLDHRGAQPVQYWFTLPPITKSAAQSLN